MMRLRTLLHFLVILTPLSVAMGDESGYQWQRDVTIPSITAAALVTAPLDPHVFEFTRDGWPDVRLQNQQGDAVSFLIRPVQTGQARTTRHFWPTMMRAAHVNDTAGLQVEFELGRDEPTPSGFRIVTPLSDFEHRVQIESSIDGTTWADTGTSAVIFDYSRHVNARNDLIPLKEPESRRFRITISDLTAEQDSEFMELKRVLQGGQEMNRTERTTVARRPFRIDRIEFYRDQLIPESREVPSTSYTVHDFAIKEDAREHQTIIEFSTRRAPVTGLKIITDARNFSRAISIENEVTTEDESPAWHPLTKGTVTRFAVGSLERDETSLSLPENRSGRYRVIIDNRDSPPLVIEAITATGPKYQLAFLASPGETYRVDYGSADAKAGQYDTAALKATLQQMESPLDATLQDPKQNLNAPVHRTWRFWNDPRVLIGTIIFLTAILAWVLFQTGRRLSDAVKSDEPQT